MRNLSEVSIHNRVLVWYFIILVAIAGIFSYMKLGRMEDPTYTVRTMVVSVAWPGATAEQMQEQVTDKIEKKLQDTPNLDYIKSYSRPGQSVIYVYLDDKAPRDSIRSTWHEVRNLTEDMKKDLPDGVYGPYSTTVSTTSTVLSMPSQAMAILMKNCARRPKKSAA